MRHPVTHLVQSAVHGAFRVTHGIANRRGQHFARALSLAVPDRDVYPVIQSDPRTLDFAVRDAGLFDSAFTDAYGDAYQWTPVERAEFASRLAASDGPGH